MGGQVRASCVLCTCVVWRTGVPPIPCVSQAPQSLVLEEGVYVKCDVRGLCKVSSAADRTVLATMRNGVWRDVPEEVEPKGDRRGKSKGKGKASIVVQGDHPAIVVPHGCTVIVPTEAGVKELLTAELHTELVDFVEKGSAVFDTQHLLRFMQGEAVVGDLRWPLLVQVVAVCMEPRFLFLSFVYFLVVQQ